MIKDLHNLKTKKKVNEIGVGTSPERERLVWFKLNQPNLHTPVRLEDQFSSQHNITHLAMAEDEKKKPAHKQIPTLVIHTPLVALLRHHFDSDIFIGIDLYDF